MVSKLSSNLPLRLEILGVGVHRYTFDGTVRKIFELIDLPGFHHVVTVNPEFIMRARIDPGFRQILNQASLSTADGFGLRLAARYLNTPITWIPIVREVQALWQGVVLGIQALLHRNIFNEIPEVVAGSDLVDTLAQKAAKQEKTIYLIDRKGGLGSDTAKKAADILRQKYTNLRIVGAETTDPDEPGLIYRIAKAKPDILLVAFGFPTQEIFLAKHGQNLGTKVGIGVGGALDYIAGIRRRPPQILRGKFEWLWRLIIPSGRNFAEYLARVRRILTAFPFFPLAVLRWKLRWGQGLSIVRVLSLDFGGVTNQNGVERIIKHAWHIVPIHQIPVLGLFYLQFIPDLERGKITEDEVWTTFMRYFGSKRDLSALRTRILNGFQPNKPLWDVIKSVKRHGGVRLAMLTNNIREWMDLWERRFHLSKYFSTIVSSCDVGMRKPNPDIFRLFVNRLDVLPAEIIYVDDHTRNVLQARRLGMKAIRCSNPQQCAKMLREILPVLDRH